MQAERAAEIERIKVRHPQLPILLRCQQPYSLVCLSGLAARACASLPCSKTLLAIVRVAALLMLVPLCSVVCYAEAAQQVRPAQQSSLSLASPLQLSAGSQLAVQASWCHHASPRSCKHTAAERASRPRPFLLHTPPAHCRLDSAGKPAALQQGGVLPQRGCSRGDPCSVSAVVLCMLASRDMCTPLWQLALCALRNNSASVCTWPCKLVLCALARCLSDTAGLAGVSRCQFHALCHPLWPTHGHCCCEGCKEKWQVHVTAAVKAVFLTVE